MVAPRVLVALVLVCSALHAQEAARVSYLVGSLDVYRAGKKIPARVSLSCQVGDSLVVAKASRAELRYSDNTLLRLEEFTRAVLTVKGKGVPEPTVLGGKVWANVKKIGEGGSGFGVRTPTAVAAVRGTVFGVGAADSASRVRLYEGKVDVGSRKADSALRARGEVPGPKEVSLEDWVRLLRGEEVTFRRDGSWNRSKFDPKGDLSDPWVKWNAERDRADGRAWDSDSAAKAPKSRGGTEPDPFQE